MLLKTVWISDEYSIYEKTSRADCEEFKSRGIWRGCNRLESKRIPVFSWAINSATWSFQSPEARKCKSVWPGASNRGLWDVEGGAWFGARWVSYLIVQTLCCLHFVPAREVSDYLQELLRLTQNWLWIFCVKKPYGYKSEYFFVNHRIT